MEEISGILPASLNKVNGETKLPSCILGKIHDPLIRKLKQKEEYNGQAGYEEEFRLRPQPGRNHGSCAVSVAFFVLVFAAKNLDWYSLKFGVNSFLESDRKITVQFKFIAIGII